MNGLLHLLDLAGVTIAQLQAEVARLGAENEELREALKETVSRPASPGDAPEA